MICDKKARTVLNFCLRISIFFLKMLNVFARRSGGSRGICGAFGACGSRRGNGRAMKYIATATAKKGPATTAKSRTGIPWGVVAEATGIQRDAPPFVYRRYIEHVRRC